MKLPPLAAYCNSSDGRTWSLWYEVSPSTGEQYWVQFEFAPKAAKNAAGVNWSVLECRMEGEATEETQPVHLDHETAAAVAKTWYDNGAPLALPGLAQFFALTTFFALVCTQRARTRRNTGWSRPIWGSTATTPRPRSGRFATRRSRMSERCSSAFVRPTLPRKTS